MVAMRRARVEKVEVQLERGGEACERDHGESDVGAKSDDAEDDDGAAE